MHNRKTLSILSVLAIAIVVAALVLIPFGERSGGERELLFPALSERINDTATVTIRDADGEVVIATGEDGWTVPDMHGYPADAGAIRSLLLGLSQARIVEPKTAKPPLYHRLGVADVGEDGSIAVQVIVEDAARQTLASVLVGKEASSEDRYVRRTDEARAYRVTALDAVDADVDDWIRSTIVDVARDEIAVIEVDNGEDRVELEAGPGGEMSLRNVPEGMRIGYRFALDDFASTFAGLELDDVRLSDGLSFGGELKGRAILEDELVVAFETALADKATWFRFRAEAPDAAAGEVAERARAMNERWDGWAYRLRDADLKRLAKRKADLLESVGESPGPDAGTDEDGAANASATGSRAGEAAAGTAGD